MATYTREKERERERERERKRDGKKTIIQSDTKWRPITFNISNALPEKKYTTKKANYKILSQRQLANIKPIIWGENVHPLWRNTKWSKPIFAEFNPVMFELIIHPANNIKAYNAIPLYFIEASGLRLLPSINHINYKLLLPF